MNLSAPSRRLAGLLVDRGGGRDAVVPARGGVDVDLDDAGIGRDADDVEARVGRRRVALDMHRQADRLRGGLGGGDQLEPVLERLDRRQEDAEPAVADLGGDRGADLALDLGDLLLGAVLLDRRVGGERAGLRAGAAACRASSASGSGRGPRGASGSSGTTCGYAVGCGCASATTAAGGSRRASRRARGTACRAGSSISR